MVICRNNECNVINVKTLENEKTKNTQQYHSEGVLMNQPVDGRPIIVGGTHNIGDGGIHAEILNSDLTWSTLKGHENFPDNYKKFRSGFTILASIFLIDQSKINRSNHRFFGEMR